MQLKGAFIGGLCHRWTLPSLSFPFARLSEAGTIFPLCPSTCMLVRPAFCAGPCAKPWSRRRSDVLIWILRPGLWCLSEKRLGPRESEGSHSHPQICRNSLLESTFPVPSSALTLT